MNTAYYDANYLFKLQCGEHGSLEVRSHAAAVQVLVCALHGRAEFASAAFRKVGEGAATAAQYQALLAQVHDETTAGHLEWLPLTDAILDRVERVFATAPATAYLRAADAIHLATAAEHGYAEIHSNDKSDLELVRAALKRSRVVALLGPRQNGKTTLARQFVPADSI